MAEDLISRRTAIEAMEDVDWYHINKDGQLVHGANSKEDEPLYKAEDVYKVLKDVQSAQPEPPTDDCISRRAAIDAVEESRRLNHHQDGKAACAHEYEHRHFLKLLRDLPSSQPERQKGEWIDHTEDGYVECPFCHSATNCDGNKDELHFCFSCGADMRGEQDG